MAIDFEAEGLLEGAATEGAREARLELRRTLESEGFGLEELRRAAREGRLALLPVERVPAAEGARYTRYAESLRSLAPLAGPSLQHLLNLRMREEIRQAVVSQAELQSGRLPGAQTVTVGFVDIVGFTELGEEVPPAELGAVVRDFEHTVEDAVRAPVRLVKTIGDAAMLVAPEPGPVVAAVVDLVEASRKDEERPLLCGGIACGEALPRAGDWYGRPVNLASRLTELARRGSVLASKDVHDAAPDDHSWSYAGRRRLKGVSGEVELYRVRPVSPRQ